MKKLLAAATMMGLVAAASTAFAANYIVHLHGRGQKNWSGCDRYTAIRNSSNSIIGYQSQCEVARKEGWTNVAYFQTSYNSKPVTPAYNTITNANGNYDGSAKLDGTETNTKVKTLLTTYCSGGNQCIIHCYSAGCMRMLKVFRDINTAHTTSLNVAFVEASASAAGGTGVADAATSGSGGFLAKLSGNAAPIDNDLKTTAARNTWSTIQNSAAGGYVGTFIYNAFGNVDMCTTVLGKKLCGNGYINEGFGDGAVGVASAAGYRTKAVYDTGCTTKLLQGMADAAYYDNMGTDWEGLSANGIMNSGCLGVNRDHMGMPGMGTVLVGWRQVTTADDYRFNWQDQSNLTACNNALGECDLANDNPATGFHNASDGIVTAKTDCGSATTGLTSVYSCAGRCGQAKPASPTNACGCDPNNATGRCGDFSTFCSAYFAGTCH